MRLPVPITGDLIQARGLRISLLIEAIFWLPDEDLGVGV